MGKAGRLTLKIFLAVVLNDHIDGFAQVLMKKGLIETIGFPLGIREFGFFIIHNAASPLLWMGILLYAVNFFLWIGILTQIDLSLAIPLGSTTYLIVPAIAVVLLHEKLTFLKCAGIFLIIIGILFVSKSKSSIQQPVLVP